MVYKKVVLIVLARNLWHFPLSCPRKKKCCHRADRVVPEKPVDSIHTLMHSALGITHLSDALYLDMSVCAFCTTGNMGSLPGYVPTQKTYTHSPPT
jgi:hypothetical protein